VKFIAKNDNKDSFRFISMQNKKITMKIIDKKYSNENNSSIILINNKIIETKSTAIISILSELKFPYNLFVFIKIFPTCLLDFFYNLIAKNRYKIFGKTEHCSLIYSSDIKDIRDKIIE
jgi:predicted DCC family thiol-disulfide oxidoreductase YuxK